MKAISEFSIFKEKIDSLIETDIDGLLEAFTVCDIADTHKDIAKNRYTHETRQLGSYIYLLLNEYDEVIYVGETGESIIHRLYGDGSGSHCNKEWFNEVKKVRYYRNEAMDWMLRLAIESLLVLKFLPKYNMSKTKRDRPPA